MTTNRVDMEVDWSSSKYLKVIFSEIQNLKNKLNGIEIKLEEQKAEIRQLVNIIRDQNRDTKFTVNGNETRAEKSVKQKTVSNEAVNAPKYQNSESNFSVNNNQRRKTYPINLKPHFKAGGDTNKESQYQVENHKADFATANTSTNCVQEINKLYFFPEFKERGCAGPSHNPMYTVTVTLNGRTFIGRSKSKQDAKNEAARVALEVLKPQFDEARNSISKEIGGAKKLAIKELNEKYSNAKYEFEENGGFAHVRFKATAVIEERRFEGFGPNQQVAKAEAARRALSELNCDEKGNKDFKWRMGALTEEQQKADYIGRLVHEKFASLTSNDPLHSKFKVLAGIVLIRNDDLGQAEVISLATGTKCISGGHTSVTGEAFNDMHAEILARRCLLSYLYNQLELAKRQPERSIFIKPSDSNRYILRKCFEFHLFISTAPCGDASVFSLNDNGGERQPNKAFRGLLRTKTENSEDSIPVKPNTRQTWDGILHGNRLLTMTCSDKICLWNVVGVQGALLSYFIEPIYFHSIILGSLYKEEHLKRAFYGRIEDRVQDLPRGYYLNRPALYELSVPEERQASNSTNFSLLWCQGSAEPEIVDAATGRPELGVSKYCKLELGKRFSTFLLENFVYVESMPYSEFKSRSGAYKTAKEILVKAFADGRLGEWISKPVEQDMFEVF